MAHRHFLGRLQTTPPILFRGKQDHLLISGCGIPDP